MDRKVVITGMGAITPLGNDLATTWDGIIHSQSGIDYISTFDVSTFPVKIAGEAKNFSLDESFLPKEYAVLAGRSAQLCLKAAQMSIADAGIDLNNEDLDRIGISLGADEEFFHFSMIDKIYPRQHVYRAFKEGQDTFVEILTEAPLLGKIWSFRKRADIGSKLLSLVYNLQGPINVSHTACASSGHAIGKAKRLIENGDCDIAVAGGHCSMLSEFVVAGFYLLGTLSQHNEEPTKASRPFDRKRDGFVMGEGAGLLILEELSHARKRGARIYAELSGYGSSSNSYRITDSPPDGGGGDLCMQKALKDARKDKTDIDYINAHGTATILNDRSETLSIKKVFGEQASKILISSSKSMIGHLVTGSSAVELVISVMAIKDNIVPPTINLDTPDPQCDLDYVPNVAREKKLNVVLSNSFAFGGQNCTLIVERFKG
jgi:3-oxoacyl-[acyl-carrier-protein] synthase II